MRQVKDFICTIPGKVMLFSIDILAAITVLICIIGAVFMSEYGFYSGTKEDALKKSIESEIQVEVHDVVWGQVRESVDDSDVSSNSISTNTNLRYAIYDSKGKMLVQNDKLNLKKEDKKWKYHLYYCGYNYIDEFGEQMYGFNFETKESMQAQIDNGIIKEENIYEVCAYLETQSQVEDVYFWLPKIINPLYGMRYTIYPIGVIAFFVAVFCFVALMYSSGRRADREEIVTTIFYRIPWDFLMILVWIICGAIVLAGEFTVLVLLGTGNGVRGFDIWHHLAAAKITAAWMIVYAILIGSVCLAFCMSTATRIKKKDLLKNTVLYRVLRWIKRRKLWGKISNIIKQVFRIMARSPEYIPLMGRTIILLVLISFIELFVFAIAASGYNLGLYFAFWLLEKMVLVPAILYVVWTLKKLQKAGMKLAAGDMDYQIDTEKLFWEFKQHGENLNHIAEGMNLAVSEKMKSERLKTELITNVSHDIKTPLTSIINYADLIGREKCENEAITEYCTVLLRQSERLKRLIEDLVEASKASTGNLDVELAPCEAQIFLSQVFGEYEEKLKERNLELVTNQPEKSIFVMADGRRMLRIFDNLMTNICKYAQPGTRVYISLEERENNAVIIFKNISHAALNLSVDELMERFVRGDASRNTEGNGLGLSIARSLAELQNGSLDLEIDGDLFKAILCFPMLKVS